MIVEKVTEPESRIASLADSIEKIDALNQLAFEIRNTNPPRSYSPVSYTHLDVYKRQTMPFYFCLTNLEKRPLLPGLC